MSKRLLRGPNSIAKKLLCPRLLRDSETTTAYVKAFPLDQYKIKAVKGSGRYHLDDRDDVIKNVLRRGEIWETKIRAVLKKHVQRGTTVVDAGAHIGTHTILMSKLVGARGRVYAFEPQRKIFRELVHNLSLNKSRSVIPLRFALGAKPAVIEMGSPPKGNEGHTSVGHGGDPTEMRTIDSFGLANVSLLKIDVEGFEDHVLAGARQTISRHRPIILIEIQGGHDPYKAPLAIKRRIWKTISKLTKLGYQVEHLGAHDFIARYTRPTHHGARVGFFHEVAATEPRLRTRVGTRRGGVMASTGRAGRLFFGPYEYLPAGSYLLKLFGRVGAESNIELDVVSQRGKKIHARQKLKLAPRSSSHNLAVLSFSLATEAQDVEYRCAVDAGAKVQIERIEVQRVVTDE